MGDQTLQIIAGDTIIKLELQNNYSTMILQISF